MIIFSLLGLVTVLISIVGIAIAVKQAIYLAKPGGGISSKLSHVFWTDAGIYFITVIFGILAFITPWRGCIIDYQWIVAFFVRLPLLAINILASWNLYQHYKMIH